MKTKEPKLEIVVNGMSGLTDDDARRFAVTAKLMILALGELSNIQEALRRNNVGADEQASLLTDHNHIVKDMEPEEKLAFAAAIIATMGTTYIDVSVGVGSIAAEIFHDLVKPAYKELCEKYPEY
jgi:hypothetical protein